MPTLFYFHDPMCSWCWAFRPVWQTIREELPHDIGIRQVLGGLAPDDSEPMPEELRKIIQHIWRTVQDVVPGTAFNFDFWDRCSPRRSTYPACRAVIAARRVDPGFEEPMIHAIQRAYYLEARNPSDDRTLIELAGEIGIDQASFVEQFSLPAIHAELLAEIDLTQQRQVRGFPTLILQQGDQFREIDVDYSDARISLEDILSTL
jgi:putative protein-disulfide isomerase